MMETLTGLDQVAPAAHGVLQVPVYVLMAYLFWRAARLLRADIPERARGVARFRRTCPDDQANVLVVLAVVGPALAAIGYVNAAEAVMVPAALSLALIGLLLALQPVVRDLYAVIRRTTPEKASEALIPVLINFLLVFAGAAALRADLGRAAGTWARSTPASGKGCRSARRGSPRRASSPSR
jgi:potassium efflux system protein